MCYEILYRILTVITPLITTPIISRALGAEQIGVYSATQAYVNYFMLFSMLGIENYGNRTIAAVRTDKIAVQRFFWNIYAIQFVSVLTTIGIYITSFLWISDARKIVSIIQGLWLLSCLLDINWFFFGCEQFKITVARNIIVKFVSVLAIVILIRNPEDIYIYTAIMSGSVVISQLLLWKSLFNEISFEMPYWDNVKQHIAPIIHLFIPVIGLSVFHIMDKTMLDLLSNEENVGYYYSADKIINIPLGVISAVSTVMLPRISFMFKNNSVEDVKKVIEKSAEIVAFLTAAIGFGIATIAKDFVPLFFGKGFEACIPLIYWFVPVLYAKAWGEMIRSQYLIPLKKDRLYINAVCLGALINIITNYFLITKYAALGAVLGTLIAETTVMSVEIFGVLHEINFVNIISQQTVYFVFAIIMLVVTKMVALMINLSSIYKIIVCVAIGGFLYLTQCIIYWRIHNKSVFDLLIENSLHNKNSINTINK